MDALNAVSGFITYCFTPDPNAEKQNLERQLKECKNDLGLLGFCMADFSAKINNPCSTEEIKREFQAKLNKARVTEQTTQNNIKYLTDKLYALEVNDKDKKNR